MSNRFLTADTHFNHGSGSVEGAPKGIIKYCSRNFSTVHEMNKALTERWNSVVKPEDTVYHLGDFSFGNYRPYLEKLNGQIHLIKGNHDKQNDYHIGFASVGYYAEIKIENNLRICCSHYAMRVWNHSHFGWYHCYGHSHGNLPGIGRSMDVGVDTHNFYPYSVDEIVEILSQKSIINPVEEIEYTI